MVYSEETEVIIGGAKRVLINSSTTNRQFIRFSYYMRDKEKLIYVHLTIVDINLLLTIIQINDKT